MSNNPLAFIVMPFGKKMDAAGIHEIDFDRIYQAGIRPACLDAGLDVIRADEEKGGGIIHTPMFERLLCADFVIAEVTIPNANVYYELGVRHAARPRSTLMIFAPSGPPPFDINMLRGLPYKLNAGYLEDAEAESLRSNLTRKIKEYLEDRNLQDSPLFGLIPDYPGVPMDPRTAASFRERLNAAAHVREALRESVSAANAREAVARFAAEHFGEAGPGEHQTELFLDLLRAYRDVKDYDALIASVERLPDGPLAASPAVRELFAFALNRRKGDGDRRRAKAVLDQLIADKLHTSETLGLLGRIHKDNFDEALANGSDFEASLHLDEAVAAYREGFHLDPSDYYPGVNAATLMFVRAHRFLRRQDPWEFEEAQDEARTYAHAAAFAVARRGGIDARDYWTVATALETATLAGDWKTARKALRKLYLFEGAAWMFESTAANLAKLRDACAFGAGSSSELDASVVEFDRIIEIFRLRIDSANDAAASSS